MRVHAERAAMLAMRVAKLVALRHTAKANRKVAIVLFNFPPNAGATGTAAFLAVFESLFNTLKAMKRDGYSVEVPATVDANCRTRILKGNAERFGSDANVVHRISADDHVRRENASGARSKRSGARHPAAARPMARSIHVLGERFGNVLVGIQPAFGYEGDPMRLLFERSFTPTHAFSAFYRYLREDFAANAILHFGTHGALEFMPGKQSGLSDAVLAGPPDRRCAEPLSLCRQQSVGRHDRQAPLRCDAGELPDAAAVAGRPLSRPRRPQGLDRPLARAGAGSDGARAALDASSRHRPRLSISLRPSPCGSMPRPASRPCNPPSSNSNTR